MQNKYPTANKLTRKESSLSDERKKQTQSRNIPKATQNSYNTRSQNANPLAKR